MIIIKNLSGQLGNRLMRLNNALQLSKEKGLNIKFQGKDRITREIEEYFDFNMMQYTKRNGSNITLKEMGDLFFSNKYDPKDLLKIKQKYKINLDNSKTNIGIHFRYEPNPIWQDLNNESKLYEYYLNAIKFCINNNKNIHFIIFGPTSKNQFRFHNDHIQQNAFLTKFKFYNNIIQYLKDNQLSFDYSITIKNSNEIYIKDFIQMSQCDGIISSHSTFCICASYLEKEKYIIHSKYILDFFLKTKDKFWVNLYNGGNKYYHINKII